MKSVCCGSEASEHLEPQATGCVKHSCLSYATFEPQFRKSSTKATGVATRSSRKHTANTSLDQTGRRRWNSSVQSLSRFRLSCMDEHRPPWIQQRSQSSHGCWLCEATRYFPGLSWVIRAVNGVGTCAAWNIGASGRLSWKTSSTSPGSSERAMDRPSAVPRV